MTHTWYIIELGMVAPTWSLSISLTSYGRGLLEMDYDSCL